MIKPSREDTISVLADYIAVREQLESEEEITALFVWLRAMSDDQLEQLRDAAMRQITRS
jgi:hypothetical protein